MGIRCLISNTASWPPCLAVVVTHCCGGVISGDNAIYNTLHQKAQAWGEKENIGKKSDEALKSNKEEIKRK